MLPEEKRYCLADLLDGDESERIELIDGDLIKMPPTVRIHQEISGNLAVQLSNYLRDTK